MFVFVVCVWRFVVSDLQYSMTCSVTRGKKNSNRAGPDATLTNVLAEID
jgi:hypothetical protein